MLFVVVIAAVPPVCALLGWIFWLRFVRHVHDKSGPEAVRHLPAVARAYRAPSRLSGLTGAPSRGRPASPKTRRRTPT